MTCMLLASQISNASKLYSKILKPARMRHLDEGQRRAVELFVPIVATHQRRLALEWRVAMADAPTLSKEEFLQEHFGWVKHFGRVRTKSELHRHEVNAIDAFIERINEGEKLLDGV